MFFTLVHEAGLCPDVGSLACLNPPGSMFVFLDGSVLSFPGAVQVGPRQEKQFKVSIRCHQNFTAKVGLSSGLSSSPVVKPYRATYSHVLTVPEPWRCRPRAKGRWSPPLRAANARRAR